MAIKAAQGGTAHSSTGQGPSGSGSAIPETMPPASGVENSSTRVHSSLGDSSQADGNPAGFPPKRSGQSGTMARVQLDEDESTDGLARKPRRKGRSRRVGAAESGEIEKAVDWANPRVRAILETATECFARGGFTATTLADIGRELGLRKSIVHYYFVSKAALVHEVQNFTHRQYLETLKTALSSPKAEGKSTLAGLWSSLGEAKTVRGLNIELWSEGRRDADLAAGAKSLQAEARALLTDHLKETELGDARSEDLAALTLAVLDGLTVAAERDGNTDQADRAFALFADLARKS